MDLLKWFRKKPKWEGMPFVKVHEGTNSVQFVCPYCYEIDYSSTGLNVFLQPPEYFTCKLCGKESRGDCWNRYGRKNNLVRKEGEMETIRIPSRRVCINCSDKDTTIKELVEALGNIIELLDDYDGPNDSVMKILIAERLYANWGVRSQE